MHGSYFCVAEDGERFEVEIPPSCWTTAAAASCTEPAREPMDEVMAIWAEWLKPSAGLPTVQWSLLLAARGRRGHLLQRFTGLPKVVGYSVVGTLAGLAGFPARPGRCRAWRCSCWSWACRWCCSSRRRIALRWFRHNPMVLLQSLLESLLTALAVYYVLRWLEVRPRGRGRGADRDGGSPAVLSRVDDGHARRRAGDRTRAWCCPR
jgi:hypothetical protein